MKWIREHINKMPSFNYLNAHLSTIENTIETNPDLCIEVCKSMIESLCKTFLLIKLLHTILIGSFKLW